MKLLPWNFSLTWNAELLTVGLWDGSLESLL